VVNFPQIIDNERVERFMPRQAVGRGNTKAVEAKARKKTFIHIGEGIGIESARERLDTLKAKPVEIKLAPVGGDTPT
jgi:hypothetical protein